MGSPRTKHGLRAGKKEIFMAKGPCKNNLTMELMNLRLFTREFRFDSIELFWHGP